MKLELNKKFDINIAQFEYLDLFSTLAIAVSGGSDSMALLSLTQNWANDNNKKIIVIHVDHKLRPSSYFDATHVQNYCANLNIECYILPWQHSIIKGNVQQKARLARYELITELCKKLNISQLFTGHHLEDNVENFIQRLIKGSGIIGLSSSNEHFYNNIRILRPLFNFTKSECIDYLKLENIKWVEDETNQNTKYLRNDIRANLSSILKKQDISYEQLISRLATTQEHFYDVTLIVREKLTLILAKYCFIDNLGFVKIDYKTLKDENIYIQHLLFSYLITIISGKNYLPRGSKIQHMLESIANNSKKYFTLHNTKITLTDDSLLITYEKNRKLLISSEKTLINNLLWNNRFLFKISKELTENFTVDFCSEKEYTEIIDKIDLNIKQQFSSKEFKEIILTIPTIKLNNKIVAINQINYYDKDIEYLAEVLEIIFSPTFKSKLIHF